MEVRVEGVRVEVSCGGQGGGGQGRGQGEGQWWRSGWRGSGLRSVVEVRVEEVRSGKRSS